MTTRTLQDLLEDARCAAADVVEDEPDRPTDRGVGPDPGPEGTVATVDPELGGHRAVDDHQWAAGVGGGLDRVEVELRGQGGLDGGHHHREAIGPARA